MVKQRRSLAILAVGFFSFFVTNPALSEGILGFQPGDRSLEENASWAKKGAEHIQMALKEVEKGNSEKSMEDAAAGLAALREISSEGWAPTLERARRHARYGINSARKGSLEKASLEYQNAIKTLESLKIGDIIFTHESFLNILGIKDHR